MGIRESSINRSFDRFQSLEKMGLGMVRSTFLSNEHYFNKIRDTFLKIIILSNV